MQASNDRVKYPRLLVDELISSTKRNPDKTAVISNKSYSYSELLDAVSRLANVLVTRDLKKGDRVAIFMENTWHCAISIYATLMAGGVFVIINPQTKADKLDYILNDSGAKIFLTAIDLERTFLPAIKNNKLIKTIIASGYKLDITLSEKIKTEDFENAINNTNILESSVNIIPNDLAALIYTSGSTGFPKGVMQTHQAMYFASWSLIEYLRMNEEERILLVLPIAFDYGLYQLLMSVNLGATIILERSFAYPAKIYQKINKTSTTVFPAVPTMFAMMISAYKREPFSFHSVMKITNTAAALSADFIPWLHKIFPNALIFKMYGLTECKRVCYLEPELVDKYPSSVGKAIPGTEMYLLSEDGKPVAVNEPGILHIRGPHIMAGYWKQPERSKRMLRPGKIPGEKVLCTHDIFRMDERGLFYFISRSDDIIKTRGEKVSPIEVENIILKLEAVQEAAIIGVNDDTFGQIIIAFIVLDKGFTLNTKQIKMHCTKNMEAFMVPKEIIYMDTLPKSNNGKIDKKLLVETINNQ